VTGCGFTHAHYRELLQAAKQQHRFVSFEEALVARERFVLLRHDVDLSIEAALVMARVEAELGVTATYFLLPHAHYNPFVEPALQQVAEIVALGHRLGLHYDPGFYARAGLDAAATLHWEAAALGERFGTRVRVAARHKPGLGGAVAAPADASLLDAYAPEFTERIRYRSESCQFWREGCPCESYREGLKEQVQLLIHPEWWTASGERADRVLEAWADGRKRAAEEDAEHEFQHFASLEYLGNRHLFQRRRK
jgi:hypothetical protein